MANLLNSDAVGIDISSKEHFVAVPKNRVEHSIHCLPFLKYFASVGKALIIRK